MSNQIIQPRTLKGFRDFLPIDARKRLFLIEKIREVFELYGFDPIETPAIEYLETFTGNIGEDEKLFFKFEDQGDRKVALRYDQTVPTCRFIAQYKDKLIFPFKRYQIQTVWRAEKPQKGRYREFLQCDADIVGISSPDADAETIALTLDLYKKLGFKEYVVKINDRSLFKDYPYSVITAIDKLEKIGEENVIEEIVKKGFSKSVAANFLETIKNTKPTENIKKIFSYLEAYGCTKKNFEFTPTIARSFNYSSGPIWEVVIPDFQGGSVLGGERYDKLIGRFQNQDLPATGFAIGFDRTLEAMEQFGLFPELESTAKVMITIFSEETLAISLNTAAYLRNNNIKTDLYPDSSAKLDKQLKYASKKKIPFVLIIGPEEKEKNLIKIKNMKTGEQKEIKISDIKTVMS